MNNINSIMQSNNHKTHSLQKIQTAHPNRRSSETGPFIFERIKNCSKKSEKRLDQWNQLQKKKYLAFILYFQEEVQNRISSQLWHIFRQMQKFIKIRNSNQCRIYHFSMLKKYGTLKGIILNGKKQIKNLTQILEYYSDQLYELNMWRQAIKCDDSVEYIESNISIKEKVEIKDSEDKKDNLDNIRTDLTFDEPAQNKNNYRYQQDQSNRDYEYEHQMGYLHHNSYPQERAKEAISLKPSMQAMPSMDFQMPYYEFYNYGYHFPCPQPIINERDNGSREAQWRVCHQLFLAWTSKLKSLLEDQ